MKTQYAIKIMLSKDDWVYLTEQDETTMFGLRPVLFKTRQEAEQHAEQWGVHKVVRWREK